MVKVYGQVWSSSIIYNMSIYHVWDHFLQRLLISFETQRLRSRLLNLLKKDVNLELSSEKIQAICCTWRMKYAILPSFQVL